MAQLHPFSLGLGLETLKCDAERLALSPVQSGLRVWYVFSVLRERIDALCVDQDHPYTGLTTEHVDWFSASGASPLHKTAVGRAKTVWGCASLCAKTR
jgi:hypothetical protein